MERCVCGNPWPCEDRRWWNRGKHRLPQEQSRPLVRDMVDERPNDQSLLDPTNLLSPLNPLSPLWIGNQPPVEVPTHGSPSMEHHHHDTASFGHHAVPDSPGFDHGAASDSSSFDHGSPSDSTSYDSGGSDFGGSDFGGGSDGGGGGW